MIERNSNMDALVARLLRIRGLEDATRWMMSPHPELAGQSPDAALAEGRRNEVERLLDAEESASA